MHPCQGCWGGSVEILKGKSLSQLERAGAPTQPGRGPQGLSPAPARTQGQARLPYLFILLSSSNIFSSVAWQENGILMTPQFHRAALGKYLQPRPGWVPAKTETNLLGRAWHKKLLLLVKFCGGKADILLLTDSHEMVGGIPKKVVTFPESPTLS